MPNRFGHIQRLVSLRETLRKFPDETDLQLKRAIVEALPDQYRKVYDWIGSQYGMTTSAAVMRAWGLNQNHASTLLKELHGFGLLKREQKIDSNGRTYYYTWAD